MYTVQFSLQTFGHLTNRITSSACKGALNALFRLLQTFDKKFSDSHNLSILNK